jgi:hypothetical protein
MPRVRLPRKLAVMLAVLAAVLAVVTSAVVMSLPAAGRSTASASTAASGRAAASHRPGPAAGAAASRRAADSPDPVTFPSPNRAHATTVAYLTAASGGLCSVPGIGDIGGLLGFCALGSSGLTGDLNNICQPSLPTPEPASGGIDGMVSPPASGQQPATLYDQYGVAGANWSATNLQCSDITSLIGNNVAGMVFDIAKSIDRVTITVYQSAAGEGILGWLQRVTDTLITSLGNAIYFPYLAVVVILGAIWLAWQGLIRKRGTRTIEGTIWMVVACAAAIFLIGKPAEVTGLGRGVSDGISQALNAAFAKLPSPGPSSCVPVSKVDPQAAPASYSYVSGSTVVDQNADELWSVLVCKPWLVGEFGTSVYATGSATPTVVNKYGRQLLWAQAIAVNEKPTASLIQAKQAAYQGIATSIQSSDPSVYPLFQGKQWTTRLEVGFAALFAALVAGVLVLLISVTLIMLKLSFLLLLIVGPFFLLIGTHPGFGRVVAQRWVEMLIGVLLKQAAVALVLSVLLYCYELIMGTTDAVLPWALKILMIALVTVAAFIYRKPFQHLFSAVGYGMIGSPERAEAGLARAGATARANTLAAATLAVPPFAAYRAGRWVRRNPGQAAGLAMAAASGGASAAASAAGAGLQGPDGAGSAAGDGAAGVAAGAAGSGPADGVAGRTALAVKSRALNADGSAAGGSAAGSAVAGGAVAGGAPTAGSPVSGAVGPPPLRLPARNGAATSRSAGGSQATSGTVARPAGRSGGASGVPGSATAAPAGGTWPHTRSAGSAGGPGSAGTSGPAAPGGTTSASPSGAPPVRQTSVAPSRQATPWAAGSASAGPARQAVPPRRPAARPVVPRQQGSANGRGSGSAPVQPGPAQAVAGQQEPARPAAPRQRRTLGSRSGSRQSSGGPPSPRQPRGQSGSRQSSGGAPGQIPAAPAGQARPAGRQAAPRQPQTPPADPAKAGRPAASRQGARLRVRWPGSGSSSPPPGRTTAGRQSEPSAWARPGGSGPGPARAGATGAAPPAGPAAASGPAAVSGEPSRWLGKGAPGASSEADSDQEAGRPMPFWLRSLRRR